ncbi:MAG: hypothetical protein KAI39_12885, partial [Desulfobulbaceae bacterium]|nr:hypothetical protein [Desulfobulbaceae bacterium]
TESQLFAGRKINKETILTTLAILCQTFSQGLAQAISLCYSFEQGNQANTGDEWQAGISSPQEIALGY